MLNVLCKKSKIKFSEKKSKKVIDILKQKEYNKNVLKQYK